MMEITYAEFLKHMNSLSFNNSTVEDQNYSLKDVVEEDKILFFYPKNFLFKEKTIKDAELFLFEKNRIRVINFLEDGYISITNRNLSTITKVQLKHKNRKSTSLTLFFNDDSEYVFDSQNDSSNYNFKLQTVILNIYKQLQQ
ncbi:DUF3908 family protein [Psychrobacillus sp. FSL K6-1415]|uniref:DUF3908 family protein n=1 Tax=Psychrobacillus sp. FSL K6-1415 TaxID=2921544 RepID=UPI0030F8DA4A